MKHPTQKQSLAVMLAALLAALAAFVTTSQAQVTLQQVTNGLVSYYPLDQLVPGSTNATPDLVTRRDLTMYQGDVNHFMNGPASIVADTHPGMGDSTGVMNLPNSPSPTVIVYQGSGQSALTGQGDFLPFVNQRGATMNFWLKGPLPGAQDQRVMAECAQNGNGVPFFSLSSQPASKLGLGYFLRAVSTTADPNGVIAFPMFDGTWQLPVAGNGNTIWNQTDSATTNTLFDNNWHMLTTIIETNGDLHVFVDGNYDPGLNTTLLDHEGNRAIATAIFVTNVYYTTNNYPLVNPPTTNPPPNGFVRWIISGLDLAGAATAFGGFDRNNVLGGGPAIHLSDVGFWNRPLQTNEIQFVMTNGISGVVLNTNIIKINSFNADFAEVGQNHAVNLSWNVLGANTTPGGIVISGVGDVSASPVGSATVTVGKNSSYSYTLTAHNGLVSDKQATVVVQTLAGVSPSWNLVQRFDGMATTTSGINGNGWVGLTGYYAGGLDRFNVVTVNGNKVLSPKSGYVPDTANSPILYDSAGAVAYGALNGLTIPPFQLNTLFFRFSVTTPPEVGPYFSGMDFAMGLTDFGFATGPLAGTQPPGGNGTLGPGFHLLQFDSVGLYSQPTPWNLTADNYSGSNVINSYSFIADTGNGSANGLLTNITYYCWLDVSNNNTMQNISGGVTNTINEPLYSLWIQKQGDPSRVQLFANFGGDRSWANAGQNSDNPSAFLNKVFTSVAAENFLNSDQGAFFATNNMLLLDDFYLSTNGFNATIPRLFNLTSITRAAGSATIQWESLGSMFQTNTYSVQRTLSLNPISWTTLTNGMPSGGDFTSFTDGTIGSANTAYYRISWP